MNPVVHCSRAKGKVLDVGLGPGSTSYGFRSNPNVTELVTVEREPLVIQAFLDKYGPDPKHTIVEGDAMLVDLKGPFDLVHIDILDDSTSEFYDAARIVMERDLITDGVFVVSFQSDIDIERSFRKWIKSTFTETMETVRGDPLIGSRIGAGTVIYYGR